MGTLIAESGTPGNQFDVPTEENGQARIRFRLSTTDTGFHAVSATAGGDTVYFFAASTTELASTITVPSKFDQFPAVNPAFGPINWTKWDNDGNRPNDLQNFSNYTLAITGLSTDDTTCLEGELPEESIAAGGVLTLCGRGFATTGNSVWVGGVQIPSGDVVSESATQIRVNIPEGIPGATQVIVGDGSVGCREHAPYDRIFVSCAAPYTPEPLVQQLKEGGIMLIPVGNQYMQTLLRIKKQNGKAVIEEHGGCVR